MDTYSGQFKKKLFYIEDIIPATEGYWTGAYWNGWSCPHFTKENVLKILALPCCQPDHEASDYAEGIVWNEERQCVEYHDYENGVLIETNYDYGMVIDGQITWGIGNYNWIWSEKAIKATQQ